MAHHTEGMQYVSLLPICHVTVPSLIARSGCSTVSFDEKVVVVSNLYDGLDWYKIPDRAFSRSVPIRIAKNVIVPVRFADGDALLIAGGTSGMAKVLDARTAETIQTLDHDCRSYPMSALIECSKGFDRCSRRHYSSRRMSCDLFNTQHSTIF